MSDSYANEGYLPAVGDEVFVFGGMSGDDFSGPVLDVEPNWPQVQILGPDGSEFWYELDSVYPEDGSC